LRSLGIAFTLIINVEVIPYSNVNSKKRELKRNWIERQLKQLKILTKFRISEQLIAANDWKEDVQHLCYGLVICYEPQNYFQNTFGTRFQLFPSVEQILRNAYYGDHQESGD
jgi:hypothetical protein